MKPKWTGDLIGKMHNAGITAQDIADELGIGKAYVSMILNGQRSPEGARERLEGAFDNIIKEKRKIAEAEGE